MKFALASALVVAALTSAVHAETVTLNPTGIYGLSSGITVNFDLPGPGGTTSIGSVGSYQWKVTADTGGTSFSTDLNQTLSTFCIQAFQTFSGSTTFTINSLVGAPYGNTGSPTDNGYIDANAANELQGLITAHWNDAFTSTTNAAAFQLAVWEIEYDGGNTTPGTGESYPGTNYFTTGIVTATGSGNGATAISTATTWLNGLTVASGVTNATDLGDPSSKGSGTQDQITILPSGGTSSTPPATPLPAALPAGSLLLGVAMFARKLRRKA